MIDWYDKNQCHRNETEVHDRTNGRIFKISYGDPAIAKKEATEPTPDLKAKLRRLKDGAIGVDEVAALFTDQNDWHVRRALRQLSEVAPEITDKALKNQLRARLIRKILNPREDERIPLNALFALRALIGHPGEALSALTSANTYLRAWAVQLVAEEEGDVQNIALTQLGNLAKSDPSPVVRLYLASALQRLPLSDRWRILEGLVSHGEDANDHNIPLMVWYAAEPLGAADPSRALKLASESKLPNLLPFMVRRVAALGTAEGVALLVDLIGKATWTPSG